MSVKIEYKIFHERTPKVRIETGSLLNLSYRDLGKFIEDLHEIKHEMWRAMHKPEK